MASVKREIEAGVRGVMDIEGVTVTHMMLR